MATYKLSFNLANTVASKRRVANAVYAVLYHIAEAPWAGFVNTIGDVSIVIDPQAVNKVTITTEGTIPAGQLAHLELEEVV